MIPDFPLAVEVHSSLLSNPSGSLRISATLIKRKCVHGKKNNYMQG